MQTLERIYPLLLDTLRADDRSTLALHLERYEFASQWITGPRVLDMACGCGYGSALLAERHPDKLITGVDIDPDAIAYAQAHYRLPNLRFRCADAERFTDDQPFDSIVSLETIEHLPRPEALIAHCASLLAPGGQIIASVPTTPTLDGNPHHLHDFSPRRFSGLFKPHGLLPGDRFEQVQRWQFSGLFRRPEEHQRRTRSEGVGNAVLAYYRAHPFYLCKRLASMMRYGFTNRYLTCRFARR